MSIRIGSFKRVLDFYKVSFLQSSRFYRFSLNRQHDVFDTTKFITDPWRGDLQIGGAILDGSAFAGEDDLAKQQNVFQCEISSDYMMTFAWIRDLHAIGGNNSRKYVRNLIFTFIKEYRREKKFWLNDDFKNYGIVGERIVNWIFSYSFFASGLNDKLQKEILSSISEQSSHLLKCYKAEFDMYRRLMALKAILLYFCVTKKNELRKIKKVIGEINKIVTECTDNRGLFKNRCPIDHFHVFRSLIEIRFMIKILDVDNVHSVLNDTLSKMGSIVRFLRLGDGSLSQHPGNAPEITFIPSCNTIDMALSVVAIKNNVDSLNEFERLATKNSVIIINTAPNKIKSKFSTQPGINLFDFEASLGIDKLIDRADIMVVFNGFSIKLDDKAKVFTEKFVKDNRVSFEGETQFSSKFFNLAIRREISVFVNKPQISGTDLVFVSGKNSVYFRFVFNKDVKIKEINQRNVLLLIEKNEYIFNISSGIINIVPKPITVEILAKSTEGKEVSFGWSIERTK
jgi:hypothetical protein